MNEIIETLFKEEDHSIKKLNEKFTYYSYQDAAFYFLLELEQVEFETIRNYSDFANQPKYKEFKKNFDQLEKEGEANTVERNSSLIVMVRCDSLSALEKFQHQILLLEEDEYFFKKYVILYSDKAIEDLKFNNNYISILQQKVNDKKQFRLFTSKGFQEELEEYLLILQLFIKLPFLKLTFEEDSFQSLPSKIINILGEQQEALYKELIDKSDDILAIDFEAEESEKKISEILKFLPND